eukprot:SAG25_NODE_444_length_7964_cov_123.610807_3_plen_63_part_00
MNFWSVEGLEGCDVRDVIWKRDFIRRVYRVRAHLADFSALATIVRHFAEARSAMSRHAIVLV